MPTITDIPNVQLRIEPGGRYRAMFVNPNEGRTEPNDANCYPNTLRVYSTPHPQFPIARVVDIPLPYNSQSQPTELFFTPPRPGVFVFSWVYLNPDTVPTPIEVEGTLSQPAPFVYGRLSIMKRVLDAQTCEEHSTSQIMELNLTATREFESWTCWHFYPKYMVLRTGGQSSFDLRVGWPIIEVLEVRRLDVVSRTSGKSNILAPEEYVVYNRHIAVRNAFDPKRKPKRPDGALEAPGDGTGGIVGGNEDDRRDPRISMVFPNEFGRGSQHTRAGDIMSPSVHGYVGSGHHYRRYVVGFHKGRMNVEIVGFFGFTESDLSVPMGVCMATERLALRQAAFDGGDPDEIERVLRGHKIIMEKTDTHMIQYETKDRNIGFFTGEPVIDQQITNYSRNVNGGHV